MMTVSSRTGCLCLLVILLSFLFSVSHLEAVSIHSDEQFQRRLGDNFYGGDDRSRYENLLRQSNNIRKEIAILSRSLPDESASNQIKQYNDENQRIIREMLQISQVDTSVPNRNPAAERAIERAQKRESIRRLEAEKKRREEEDVFYIQNLRKMELVDNTVSDLHSRAVSHGLSDNGMSRINDFLDEYRSLEANYIFNGTDIQEAQAQKRMIEKYIGDSQAIEITNMQRQKELLDRTIQELAARGVSFMCRSEMKTLDQMLGVYREYGFRLIEYSNSKSSASLTGEIASAQKAAQSQKLSIEKFIGTTKRTSSCTSSASKRHFFPKSSSS